MNAKKGKGKPRPNKPPNPNPPQKEEQVDVEIAEIVPEEPASAQKTEDRVPEIISEIVTPPVGDSKEKEEDSPKKPKRNRGKKKKHEKDEGNAQDEPSENVENVLEIVEIQEPQETPVDENLAPSARKKKNKNKKATDSENKTTENFEKELKTEDKSAGERETITKEDSKPQEVSDQEAKALKKKNKKKKQRNDSERSDVKAEEVSCVSAFQKLLKDEKGDDKVCENEPSPVEVVKLPEIPKSEEMNISAFIQELEKVEDIDYTSQETKSSGKNKKKNKKDKKEPPKDVDAEQITEISFMTAIKPVSKEDISSKEQHTFTGDFETDLISPKVEEKGIEIEKVEGDIKPKAKIAKPVERKRKGKGDKHTEESSTEMISLEQETETKNQAISEVSTETISQTHDITQQIEVAGETKREEIVSSESITVEKNEQGVTKPAEKKKKGKGNKPTEDLTTEITKNKDVIKMHDKKIPSPTTIMDTAEESVRPEITQDVTSVTPEGSKVEKEAKHTEIEQKSAEPKAEKKKRGKKDTVSHESAIEGKESELKEFIIPLPETKETKDESTILKESEVKIEKKSPKETETMKEVIDKHEKSHETAKKEIPAEESNAGKIFEKVQETEPKKVKLDDIIISQSGFLSDIPLMPEPIEKIQTMQELNIEIKETSFMNPSESEMGKKRKKSPKPTKQDQKPKVADSKTEIITGIPCSQVILPVTEEFKIDDIPSPPVMVLPEPEIPEVKSANIIESMALLDPFQETQDNMPFETKSKKKRKKSPKLPQTPEVISEAAESVAPVAEPLENIGDLTIPAPVSATNRDAKAEKLKEKTQESVEKGDMFSNLPSDIEISSLKADESEGSTCGFTPDIIQYPRATSQDLIDDNNNMFIQEISAAEEDKLQIPLLIPDTPLIQGSGATPLEAPENILVGIRITEVEETTKSEPEKTDLKSKMMEVNQDMEELRLSIERSLAELTAIEKNEGEVEKQFEDKKNVTGEVKPTEVKISMPTEIVAKTQKEKSGPEMEKTKSKKSKPEKTEPQSKQKSTNIPPTSPSDINPVEANIPPKTSMFFDKELKYTDEQIRPDIIQQESVPVADIPQECNVILPPVLPPVPPPLPDTPKVSENIIDTIPPVPPLRKSASKERDNKDTKKKPAAEPKPLEAAATIEPPKPAETITEPATPPVCPARKDNKNKSKNKKKGKQEPVQEVSQAGTTSTNVESKDPPKEPKNEEKTEQKPKPTQEKGKQQSDVVAPVDSSSIKETESEFEPIENFEDAMTSSADDINRTFEMIANEASRSIEASHVNPEIKIVAPVEDRKKDKKDEKINPVSQPKNLLGHPDIPVRLNKTDYKKEKNKTPNAVSAKVKIKDSVEIENKKQTKDTQTDNIKKFMKNKSFDESFSSVSYENDEFVYKYSFRKVFLQSACHVCKKDLKQARVPCSFCNLVFYCSTKHKDEDWPQHQGLCFAISTIVHLKDQKHIYGDAQNVTGQDYRLLRMQMIVSCERVLKRKLVPWEQEALLYPRMCADVACREWRQSKLQDCDGCGQISFCASYPHHLPKTHQRWCKSYALYQKLVCYQQTKGRLEPKLPSKVMEDQYRIPEKMNEVLAAMYEEKIDMTDIEYAALTQIATAPLTAAYCHQTYAATSQANGTYKKSSCTLHVVGGELQFEADALNKWEVFFVHLRPQIQELRIVMVGADLNPSNLPLELLGKVKLCETCRLNKRRIVFSFQDKTTYHDYRASDDFIAPDMVCAFNPSIKRCAMYNGKDPWPKSIGSILKQRVPFLVTAYTSSELQRDLVRVKECAELDVKMVIPPGTNGFASVRPDRNFISDDEAPLLSRNCCLALICASR